MTTTTMTTTRRRRAGGARAARARTARGAGQAWATQVRPRRAACLPACQRPLLLLLLPPLALHCWWRRPLSPHAHVASMLTPRRRRRSHRCAFRRAGKPGVRLTLEDLQSHFGVGLKEAANRLGICPTTLKRACRCVCLGLECVLGWLACRWCLECTCRPEGARCACSSHPPVLLGRPCPARRRHGIQRWPRRQLQKVNKALDELEARQMMQPQQHLAGNGALGSGALGSGGYGADAGGGLPPADTRWTTLARFIPAYQGGLGGGMPGFQVRCLGVAGVCLGAGLGRWAGNGRPMDGWRAVGLPSDPSV